MQTVGTNLFVSCLIYRKDSFYSLRTTDQVYEANDLVHRMTAFSSDVFTLICTGKIQQTELHMCFWDTTSLNQLKKNV